MTLDKEGSFSIFVCIAATDRLLCQVFFELSADESSKALDIVEKAAQLGWLQVRAEEEEEKEEVTHISMIFKTFLPNCDDGRGFYQILSTVVI